MGSRLIPMAGRPRGNQVVALVRPGSETQACRPRARLYWEQCVLTVAVLRTASRGMRPPFIQTSGRGSPQSRKSLRSSLRSINGRESRRSARPKTGRHRTFLFLCERGPFRLPPCHAYIAARSACEAELEASGAHCYYPAAVVRARSGDIAGPVCF